MFQKEFKRDDRKLINRLISEPLINIRIDFKVYKTEIKNLLWKRPILLGKLIGMSYYLS